MAPAIGAVGVALVLAAAALGGCSAAAPTGPKNTCQDSKSADGITVGISYPCPVAGGESLTAHLKVTDSTGAPLTDTTVKVNTEMPDMNMRGGDMTGKPSGDGYDVTLVLGMGGKWSVRAEVARGSDKPANVTFLIDAK